MRRGIIIGIILFTSFFSGCVGIEHKGYADDTVVVDRDNQAFVVEGRILVVEANNTTTQIENLDIKKIEISGENNTIYYSGLSEPTIIDNGENTTFKFY